jgi:phosphatidylethanolamine/phosphatidyl-N-methylethanolamine N-methyltransferase
MTSTYTDFLRGLWEDPKAVSAPTPSGKPLARAIAAEVSPSIPGQVVELGAGTGTVTAALIERGILEENLVLFESVPAFYSVLSARFPRAKIFCADAFQFSAYFQKDASIAAVVSGIPLLNHPIERRARLIEQAFNRQGEWARFIQLSYGWWPPIPAGPGLQLRKRVVFRNLPPAHIWIYRRAPLDG